MIKIIKNLKDIIKTLNVEVYIIGGYIRDKLIKIKGETSNLDILIKGDTEGFIKELEIKGYTLISSDDRKYQMAYEDKLINISELKENTIEENLAARDFTMDSIAIKLDNNQIIDPFKGRLHIKRRIIQEISDESIKNDPIRILRGIRFYIKYGMHFSAYTEAHIRSQASNILNCPRKLIKNEILNTISNDENGIFFEIADQFYVLKELIPYINELKSIGKCKYHAVDAFTHMNTAYHVFKDIQKGYISIEGIDLSTLKKDADGCDILDYLAFGIFVHDIGKFESYKKQGDKISFKGHDISGYNIINKVCDDLGFSVQGKELVGCIVKNHMYPLSIFKNNAEDYKKDFYNFFNTFKEKSPYLIIASFCDVYATRMYLDVENEKNKYKDFIKSMFFEYKNYIKLNR